MLADRRSFRSARELHGELAEKGCSVGLVTVYRLLEKLLQWGEVEAICGDHRVRRYRLSLSDSRHHHLLCRECDDVVELDGDQLRTWASRVAAQHGFTEVVVRAAVVGTCHSCHSSGTAVSGGGPGPADCVPITSDPD